MARTKESLEQAIVEIQALRKEFWSDLKLTGKPEEFNQELEKALRLADFLELGELMARDALNRNESCGGHFREEYQYCLSPFMVFISTTLCTSCLLLSLKIITSPSLSSSECS